MTVSNLVVYDNPIPGSTDIPLTWTSVPGGTPDEDNLLVVCIHHSSAITTVPTGWTSAQTSDTPEMTIYWKFAAATEANATWQMGGADQAVLLYGEFHSTTGWDSTPVDVGASGTKETSATSASSGTTATTSQAEALAIAAFALSGGADAVSPAWTNSFTEVTTAVSESGQGWSDEAFMGMKILSSTGTQTTTLSWSSPSKSEAEGAIVVFLPVPSSVSTSGTINGGGGISATVTKNLNQILRPASTIAAGTWDTGPTTGQSLDGYTSDDSDSTYIEDTTV